MLKVSVSPVDGDATHWPVPDEFYSRLLSLRRAGLEGISSFTRLLLTIGERRQHGWRRKVNLKMARVFTCIFRIDSDGSRSILFH
jgi:hypothetical protein